jgi:hypothetical protein
MIQICPRTASAVSIQRTVPLAFPLTLILAACSGREQTAVVPHATEGYGSVSPPPSVPGPYAPYEHLTESLRRSGGP